MRGSLIIASALVAAKAGLKTLITDDLTFAALSVFVAAGTALEAWLKPREKWKGFMADREDSEDLLMRLDEADANDPKAIDEYRKEFQTILTKHREKYVF